MCCATRRACAVSLTAVAPSNPTVKLFVRSPLRFMSAVTAVEINASRQRDADLDVADRWLHRLFQQPARCSTAALSEMGGGSSSNTTSQYCSTRMSPSSHTSQCPGGSFLMPFNIVRGAGTY
jgi:hypothetical protein